MQLGKWFRLAWDRAAAAVLIGAGSIALFVGWVGVSGEAYPAKQLPFIISAGIGGVSIIGLGAMFWLSGDLRDEWTKLDRIEQALDRVADSGLVDRQALQREAERSAPPVAIGNGEVGGTPTLARAAKS